MVYILPDPVLAGRAARKALTEGVALPIGERDFSIPCARVLSLGSNGVQEETVPVVALKDATPAADGGGLEDVLVSLAGAPSSFAGRSIVSRPLVMGIVNVTPDSFSDGGLHVAPEQAVAHARELVKAGADIVDIGGESTRPGSDPVSVDVEIARVVPVVEALAADGVCVSIDTRRAAVMRAALKAGAAIINDVTALTGDPESLPVAASFDAHIVLMHMQGEPRTMQNAPTYAHVLTEVFDFLQQRVETCVAAGIPRERIAVDPGIGFGKTFRHNLELMEGLGLFLTTGCTVLLGASRKGWLGRITGEPQAERRAVASVAAAMYGMRCGAGILRVHDVKETRDALDVWQAIQDPDAASAG